MPEMKPVPTAPSSPSQPRSARSSPGQTGVLLTTAGGVRLPDTDHSLKAGQRGPTLIEDSHFREKLTHFDHERIPERVVHACGSAARGTFRANGVGADVCATAFLAAGEQTEVFVRFSTVLGSRGSADTVRDVRGFATKFHAEQGEISILSETTSQCSSFKMPSNFRTSSAPASHTPIARSRRRRQRTTRSGISCRCIRRPPIRVLWAMSDRAIPRSYRTMEGFGVHTLRLVNAGGESVLAKFHWKPPAGVHSLVWEEAPVAAGVHPDIPAQTFCGAR